MFCYVIYEKRFPLLPFLNSFWYKKRSNDLNFNQVNVQSSRKLITKKEVDVIIPTLGRKKYLLDVLKDLSVQTILPKNVIIVEQNPDPNSKTELDYLTNREWPFNVKHEFIHQLGVCNARNLAIKNVESEWAFFGDDDIRFSNDLLENAFNSIEKYGVKAINTLCLQPKEKQTYFKTSQTPIFGSGTSVINSKMFNSISFDSGFEFGFGEDSDFGMQIRNLGEDVVFIPNILITHLKAPIGGYRTESVTIWKEDSVQPKPSPTIMLYYQKHLTINQNLGYKLLLFINFYKEQSIKNPFKYISSMKKKWNRSVYWSNELNKRSNA